jgi:hypothetical protein
VIGGETEGDFTDNCNVTNKSSSPFLNLSSTRKYEFPHKNYQFDELLGLASESVDIRIWCFPILWKEKQDHTSFNKEVQNSSIDSLNYEHLYQHWKLMFPNFVGGIFIKKLYLWHAEIVKQIK